MLHWLELSTGLGTEPARAQLHKQDGQGRQPSARDDATVWYSPTRGWQLTCVGVEVQKHALKPVWVPHDKLRHSFSAGAQELHIRLPPNHGLNDAVNVIHQLLQCSIELCTTAWRLLHVSSRHYAAKTMDQVLQYARPIWNAAAHNYGLLSGVLASKRALDSDDMFAQMLSL